MILRRMPFVVALAILIGVACAANAQTVSGDWGRAASQTRKGDVVHVTDAGGRAFKWKLAETSIDELLRDAGVARHDVTTLAVERVDPPWNGALIGLALAGTPWLLVCAVNDWCYYNEYGSENLLRLTAATTTAVGAGIGALIDLSIRRRMTLFQKASTQSLLVSPNFSGRSAGVRLYVTF
jgi:hypothetical protein